MAIHSSILTWRIPWTEEPGGPSPGVRKESNTAEATEHACTEGQRQGTAGRKRTVH